MENKTEPFLQIMRRSRRGRLANWALIFVVYGAIQVYSATIKEATLLGDTENAEASVNSADDDDDDTTPNPNFDFTTERAAAAAAETTELLNDLAGSTTTTEPIHHRHNHHGHPTYRPKRWNCTPPAIEQFPRPLMGPNIRRHGGLVIHVLVAIFTFLGLAIVCDDYFVASLDRICEGMHHTQQHHHLFLTNTFS